MAELKRARSINTLREKKASRAHAIKAYAKDKPRKDALSAGKITPAPTKINLLHLAVCEKQDF